MAGQLTGPMLITLIENGHGLLHRLKEHFFEHLSKISSMGQIIVVENIDLPANIRSLAHVEVFTGDPSNGRFGLFPFEAPPL